MKRIAIFCDGTWNRVSAKHPTNVRIAAQLLNGSGKDGVAQLNYYAEGVGTSFLLNEWLETRLAGAFGWGLFDKIAQAYGFLIFNYEPGDEIFIFGFSRGAFTARSLAGLIRKCGILPRARIGDIREAFDFYKLSDPKDDKKYHPDKDLAQEFRMKLSPDVILKEIDRDWRIAHGATPAGVKNLPLLNIKYVGVWDTVGALGVPKHLLISKITGMHEKYKFYDNALSSTVHAARHAVAVDEGRLSFEPTLWDNVDRLNGDADPPRYAQKWFPGDHGSVGGGGDITGHSNAALAWVLEGAIAQGLAFDSLGLANLFGEQDFLAPLKNQTKPEGLLDRIYRRGPRAGPKEEADLAEPTLSRLEFEAKQNDFKPYRPKTLEAIHKNQPVFKRSGGGGW